MIRRGLVVALFAITLASCGTESPGVALKKWAAQSSFRSNSAALRLDASHAAQSLRAPSSSAATLHTVCGVLYFDTESANAALPSPDAQLNAVLAHAYNQLGDGASLCYHAASSWSRRTVALKYLVAGVGGLAEGLVRAAAVTN